MPEGWEPARRTASSFLAVDVDHGRAELVGDPDRGRSWTLLVDGTVQSHVDLDDPTHLEFEYVRCLGHVVDVLEPPAPAPVRVLHLGGGAWTLARYVAATRPASRQRVVELDAALVDLVGARLPAEGLGIEVRVDDARRGLERVATGGVDLLVLDAFAGARIPAHLTSVEFVRTAVRALAPDGVYAANVADCAPLGFARAQVAALGAVFAEVAVLVPPDVLKGRRFGNLVLLGSRGRLPAARLARRMAADPFPARLLADDAAREFAGDAPVPTDATATPSPLPPPGFFGRPG